MDGLLRTFTFNRLADSIINDRLCFRLNFHGDGSAPLVNPKKMHFVFASKQLREFTQVSASRAIAIVCGDASSIQKWSCFLGIGTSP